jgi:biopolymer transport protein ExbB
LIDPKIPTPEKTPMDFITFIRDHFSHAAPILACAALALAFVFERTYALFLHYPMSATSFFKKFATFIMDAKLQEANTLCERYGRKPVAKIAKAALSRAHLPDALIQDGIQLTLQDCTRAISKRTAYLATIANVATLLGLFGTIAGLIQSFEAVAHADAQQKSALLSAGIATAMNATMMGLGVAIPCMVAFSFLMNRTNLLLSDLEQAATRTLDLLKQRYYSSEFIKSPFGETSGGGASEGDSPKGTTSPGRRAA